MKYRFDLNQKGEIIDNQPEPNSGILTGKYEIETNIPELWVDNIIIWECVCRSKEKKILIQKEGE